MRIQDVQLTVAKVSNPRFRGKVRKFPRHFKGHFSIGNMQVQILPGQPGSSGGRETTPQGPRKARNWWAFAIWRSVSALPNDCTRGRICRKSPAAVANTSVFGRLEPEIGFDYHYWRSTQSHLDLFLPPPRGNWESRWLNAAGAAVAQSFGRFCLTRRATFIDLAPVIVEEIKWSMIGVKS